MSAVTNEVAMKELMTIPEVAQVLGLSRRAVYRLARLGLLPGIVRLGRRVFVRRAYLENWLRVWSDKYQHRPQLQDPLRWRMPSPWMSL